MAIARSNRPPSFGRSAGARLTVTRPAGNSKPPLAIAARTRSLLSRTAVSSRPTTENVGSPAPTSTSTRTSGASRPCGVRLSSVASVIRASAGRRPGVICAPLPRALKLRIRRFRIECRDETAPVALPGRRRPDGPQHHGRGGEAAHVATRRQQADQAARGRARVPDLRARRPQPDARDAGGAAGDRPRDQDPARGAEHQAPFGRPQGRGTRHAVDRHHAHPGALRAAGGDQAVSRPVPRSAPAPAPGHLGADRRDGRARPHRFRDRDRLENTCSTATRCCRAIAGTGTWWCRATIRWRARRKT